jgi:hypothetical protein
VGHDQVALGDGALDVEAQLGELLNKALYELDESLEAIGSLGVVLYVVRAAVVLSASAGCLSLNAVLR